MNITTERAQPDLPPDWQQERLNFEVLSWVYERTGAQCTAQVAVSEIGFALDLPYEELYRSIEFLRSRGYLTESVPSTRLCITRRGISYLELLAGRRRSIRA